MRLYLAFFPIFLGTYFWMNPFILAPTTLPIEICDNGIDDDNDGLIDLNDKTDCKCETFLPNSLIPNPSFEERICCPLDRSELYCAKTWIQASEPTTDYLHSCGWMGWEELPPPLPFPDGNGCIGFRDGRAGVANGPSGVNESNPNWKEYAGACLLSPLKAGVAYRFEFWVGFTRAFNSPPTTIVFYGTNDCVNLPFGVGDDHFGCPLNGPGWKELGQVPISGAFEWKLKEINVTPTEDIYAICIGPNCNEQDLGINTYYFFDNLVLADVKQFESKISTTGNPCSNNFSLSFPQVDTLSYQWYKNGIALVGETSSVLANIVDEDANYEVRLVGPNSCKISPVYKHKKPVYETLIDTMICPGESLFFHNAQISSAGIYADSLQSYQGCDSIINLRLHIPSDNIDTVYARIFESEKYHLNGKDYGDAGQYDIHLSSVNGCDSIVHLVLDFYKLYIPNAISPNGDGINDYFTVYAGADIEKVLSMQVFDRWGNEIYDAKNLVPNESNLGWDGFYRGKIAGNGVYTWVANIALKGGKEKLLAGSLTLLK